MSFLLSLSGLVDRLNHAIGWLTRWLVLAAVVVSAGNAVVRKVFNISSNAWLEIQWYFFAGVFMLGAGYAFYRNAHVRIDALSSRLSKRTNAFIDIVGIVLVLLPLCVLFIQLGWPFFMNAWESGETSHNAGGLIRWPVLLMIPAGFALLLLQGFSELVKRVAFLMGLLPEPVTPEFPVHAPAEPAAAAGGAA